MSGVHRAWSLTNFAGRDSHLCHPAQADNLGNNGGLQESQIALLASAGDFASPATTAVLHRLVVSRKSHLSPFQIRSDTEQSHPGRVQLLMALVDYKTNLAIRRRGLLSSWLKELPLGRRVPIYVDAPTLFLPNSPEVPVVLVGPGTGVAPMRAFVEERIRAGAAASECSRQYSGILSWPTLTSANRIDTALYFGCRSKHKDAFYPEEMAAWAGQGVHIRIAYSRDQVRVSSLLRNGLRLC